MSQHGCPERLSNRSKAFQEDGASQPTMELMVETLTGTAFEMTVSPSDTIFAIKSKIFRVEGIPVAQQHLLYNLRELDDALSLREHAIGDGARLRLVLGLRGGPMATRRLPPPEPWRDIERLLHPRTSSEWGELGEWGECRVTVLVFREGERVNMLRVRENRDGSYSPLDKQPIASSSSSSSSSSAASSSNTERGAWGGGSETRRENALTAGKMLELRRRMEALSVSRRRPRHGDKPDIQKTRSEETLSVPSLLDESDSFNNVYCETFDLDRYTLLPPIAREEDRLKLSVLVKRENEDGAILEECLDTEEFVDSALANNLTPVPTAEYSGIGVEGAGAGAGVGGWRAFGSSSQLAPPPLAHALFSSSTGDLEALRRNRILPALSRHRNREHLHLSDEGLHLPPPPAPPAPPAPRSRAVGSERRRPPPAPPAPPPVEEPADKIVKKVRLRCGFCRKRLTVATVHECRCGSRFCAPHRYAEVHGCAYDYKRPQLPRI